MNTLLSEIEKFSKSNLSQTETVITSHPCVSNETKNSTSTSSNLSKLNDRDIIEYWDKPSKFYESIKKMASIIKDCDNLVIYTGAGISTAAKIPDYRGENGIYTKKDKGVILSLTDSLPKLEETKPTISHMIIKYLIDIGKCKKVVSTNIDGLHLKSGIDEEYIAELHGNCFKEECRNCNITYTRSFNCLSRDSNDDDINKPLSDHSTNRYCDKCNNVLYDTIIHFNEGLNPKAYKDAIFASKKSDVSLVLGTTMLVSPANRIPILNSNSKLIIINRQKTPFDSECECRIFGDTDDALLALINELDDINNIPNTIDNGKVSIEIPSMNHEIKYERFKPILDKMNEEREYKYQRKGNQFIINGENEEDNNDINDDRKIKIIDEKVISKGCFIYIEKCKNINFNINISSTKIVFHNIKNANISINSNVITNYIELIHCNNITIESNVPLYTITIDNCNNCCIQFKESSLMKNIFTCNSNNTSIGIIDINLLSTINEIIDNDNEEDNESTYSNTPNQFISRFYDNKIITDRVIREGAGYATTVKEKRIADEKQEFLMNALSKLIQG